MPVTTIVGNDCGFEFPDGARDAAVVDCAAAGGDSNAAIPETMQSNAIRDLHLE